MMRFDNLTDEEVYGGIVEENSSMKRKRRIRAAIIAVILSLILVIGYDIAPVVSPERGSYLLDWLRG